jgi:hypothetical protein
MTNTMTFHDDVERAIQQYEQITSHAASRTRQMIDRYGEVEALSRLMVSADLQQGFKALRDRNQLEFTFEAAVVRYRELFGEEVVQAAQWRLEHPYDLL